MMEAAEGGGGSSVDGTVHSDRSANVSLVARD